MLIHTRKAKDVDHALKALHYSIGLRMSQIEESCRNYGLPEITKLTIIARDPNNDNMAIVLTNEDAAGMQQAVDVALKTVDGKG